jgi:hypothetical protein
MYDFYFGDKEEIRSDEEKFLISVKRMLPKWVNSIPDSEYLALHRVVTGVKKSEPVFVETGLGASTIVLLFNAIKKGGALYSWDTNAEKASLVRTVCSETICRYFECDVNKHWNSVNYLSTSPYAGLAILSELGLGVDLFFHDSEHVLDVIICELEAIAPLLTEGSFVCMDDANYNFKHTNTAFINIIRKKLSLPPVEELKDNESSEFYIEVEKYLGSKFEGVEKLKDTYKAEFKDDIYFTYFNNELNIKADLKMENLEKLEHRFDAWRITGCIS